MPVNRDSRNRDVSRLLAKAKFEAEDKQDRRIVASKLADPSILGLRKSDAAAVASTLSDAMYKVIVGQERPVFLDEKPTLDGNEAPAEETDDVDLVDDDEEDASPDDDDDDDDVKDEDEGDLPFGNEPDNIAPAPKKDTDLVILDEPGDVDLSGPKGLGDIFDLDREPVGFPDEDDDELAEGDDDLGDLDELGGGIGEGTGLGIKEDPDGIGVKHELGVSPFANEVEDQTGDIGSPEGEEEALPMRPGDEVRMSLPGGQVIEFTLKDQNKQLPQDSKGPAIPQEVPTMAQNRNASDPQMAAFLNQRQAARLEMLRTAQEQQQMPEQIAPSTDKALGNDTSYGGSNFAMEDGQTSVGIPEDPDRHTLMTMTNSEGNSLRSWNADFTPQRVPTKDPGNMMNMGPNRDALTLTDEKSGVFTQTLADTELKIPTQGNTDDLWGSKGFGNMEVPSQYQENTGERKHTRAAGQEPEGLQVFASPEWQARVARACTEGDCMGGHKVSGTVEPVQCRECGIVYAMCEGCLEQNYCPTCGLPEGREAQAQINTDLYCGTSKDKAELCLDDRGDDVNGDGGFRTPDKTGGQPKKQDARDMKLDAGEYEAREAALKAENMQIKAQNERLQVEMARLAKAAEVTLQMVDNGQVLASAGIEKIDEFFSSDMDVPALESLRKIASSLPKQQHRQALAEVETGMTRSAGVLPIQSAGVSFNPNPSMGSMGGENLASVLSEVLSSHLPKESDFDPETGVKLSRRH